MLSDLRYTLRSLASLPGFITMGAFTRVIGLATAHGGSVPKAVATPAKIAGLKSEPAVANPR